MPPVMASLGGFSDDGRPLNAALLLALLIKFYTDGEWPRRWIDSSGELQSVPAAFKEDAEEAFVADCARRRGPPPSWPARARKGAAIRSTFKRGAEAVALVVDTAVAQAQIARRVCGAGRCTPGEGVTPSTQWFSPRCDTLIGHSKT